MLCPYCNAALNENAQFCGVCGQPVAAGTPPTPPPEAFAPAVLQIYREKKYSGSLRNIQIYINGMQAGAVANDSTYAFTLAPGVYNVQCKLDMMSSKTLTVSIPAGHQVMLKVKMGWWAPELTYA